MPSDYELGKADGKREGIRTGLQKAWRIVQEEHEERIAKSCAAGYHATGLIKRHIEAEIAQLHTKNAGTTPTPVEQEPRRT